MRGCALVRFAVGRHRRVRLQRCTKQMLPLTVFLAFMKTFLAPIPFKSHQNPHLKILKKHVIFFFLTNTYDIIVKIPPRPLWRQDCQIHILFRNSVRPQGGVIQSDADGLLSRVVAITMVRRLLSANASVKSKKIG